MKIRKAILSDAEEIAKVHVDSWKTTYSHILPAEFLNKLSYKQREQIWLGNIRNDEVYVAENEQGGIVGFSTGGLERSGNYPEHAGELYAIYILEEYQRQGLGKKLMKPVLEQLKRLNIAGMIVLVLEENSSRCFYEALGAKKIDCIEGKIGGEQVTELVYAWDSIKTVF